MWGIPWPARLWLLQGPEEAVPLYTVASAEATAECAVYGKDTLASEATSVFTYSLAAALSAEATSISDTSEVLVLHFAITVLSEASARERAIGLTELPQVTAELVVSYRLYGELETLLESTGELFATEKPIGVKELLSALAVSQWGLVDEKVYALVVVLRWYLTAVDRITCTLPCADRVSQLLTAVDGYAYDLAAMGELLQKLQAVERLDYELKVGGRP